MFGLDRCACGSGSDSLTIKSRVPSLFLFATTAILRYAKKAGRQTI